MSKPKPRSQHKGRARSRTPGTKIHVGAEGRHEAMRLRRKRRRQSMDEFEERFGYAPKDALVTL